MDKIQVLVVDDSAAVRRLLADVLSADAQMEVSTAPSATVALVKLETEKPDVVTLDVEMPGVNGLELLAEIRRRAPRLPVIMFSSLTQRAAVTTLEALSLGASDYVAKPSGGDFESAMQHIRSQLLPKIKAFAHRPAPPILASAPPVRATANRGRVDAIAIGTSTGGPNALGQLMKDIPAGLSQPILIVQHMPPVFTRLLAERLSSTSAIRVHEACDGQRLCGGEAYIAPGDSHLLVQRDGTEVRASLNHGAPENSCRPAVDVLFRSMAAVYGPHTLAVVLTGMGQDGLRGCEQIHGLKGQILVQDEASSVVWGMPGAVARAGLAEAVLPLSEMAAEIVRRTKGRWAAPVSACARGASHVR